jgi:hypothetical protein
VLATRGRSKMRIRDSSSGVEAVGFRIRAVSVSTLSVCN